MTINERIKAALDPFGDPVMSGEYLPVEGANTAGVYYTFNYSTIGAAFSDNFPGYDRHLVQVHFNCPRAYDSVQRVRKTKRALFDAGFTWPDTVNASDENGQHIVFECEGFEEVDEDGV